MVKTHLIAFLLVGITRCRSLTVRVSTSVSNCDGTDLLLPFARDLHSLPDSCKLVTPIQANLPFYTYTTDEFIFVIVSKEGSVQEKAIPRDETKIKILVTQNQATQSALFDAVLACSSDCTYTISGRTITSSQSSQTSVVSRPATLNMFDISVPLWAPTILIKRVVGIDFCIVKVDARIANYDNQMEWIQASFNEEPCRTSNWNMLVVAHGPLDYSVVDLINSYLGIDIILSDRTVKWLTKVEQARISGTSIEFNDATAKLNDKLIESKLPDRKSPSNSRKLVSKTSTVNIIISICFSFVSGIAVNFALRNSIARQKQFISPNE
jgi:hypothetical protein